VGDENGNVLPYSLPQPNSDLSTAANISNLVVQLMTNQTGRGPTKAWTSINGDLIAVVLRDTLTKGERSLVANGRADLVMEIRSAYQDTMRAEAIAGVEQLTGRTVLAFLSSNHIDPDVAIECFVLEPKPGQA
jgi:uncharacterized protein YbcI